MELEEYINNAVNVFSLPDACVRIKSLIDDDTSDIEDIAEVINYDPALTAKLLRLANSALYNFPSQVDTIAKALQIIGLKGVYDFVIADGVATALSKVVTNVIDLDRFWQQSVFTALVCKKLGEELRTEEPERLFVAGLLHNVGELVVLESTPATALNCEAVTADNYPWQVQQQQLNMTYVQVTAALLSEWQLPEKIITPLDTLSRLFSKQLDIKETDQEAKILFAAVHLALCDVYPTVYEANDVLPEHCYADLSVDKDIVNDALDYANLEAYNILMIMNPGSAMVF
ncbi:HDOD domain-containing protein [Flocculibacter collagenilyticus]|uniref:HDOD domain-containing protein n=1 Tax=Flocculibacter collagenilyticus TaxID=2744479 RepID=UPI0018F3A27C|nr:HDOD domain-containing protein [Flocculibacter collagenilyticus]